MFERLDMPGGDTFAAAEAAGAPVYVVAAIIDKRQGARKGTSEYRVRWEGSGPESDTWEPLKHLKSARLRVRNFEELRRQTDKNYLKSLDKKSLLAWCFAQADANKVRAEKTPAPVVSRAAGTQTGAHGAEGGDGLLCVDCPRPQPAWWTLPPPGFHEACAMVGTSTQRLQTMEKIRPMMFWERQWCRSCAVRSHPEAVDARSCLSGHCEDCRMDKRATHGLRDSTAPSFGCKPMKRRWCGECAAHHEKAEEIPKSDQYITRCADCGLAHAAFFIAATEGPEAADDPRPEDPRKYHLHDSVLALFGDKTGICHTTEHVSLVPTVVLIDGAGTAIPARQRGRAATRGGLGRTGSETCARTATRRAGPLACRRSRYRGTRRRAGPQSALPCAGPRSTSLPSASALCGSLCRLRQIAL